MKRRLQPGAEDLLLHLKRRRFNHLPLPSCCSSNVSKQKLTPKDLEEVSSGGVEMEKTATFYDEERERNQTTAFCDLLVEGTKMEPTVAAPPSMKEGKTPSEAELQDFFSAVEKDIQNKFSIKYNFDFVKEKALEGRYEWVRVKP